MVLIDKGNKNQCDQGYDTLQVSIYKAYEPENYLLQIQARKNNEVFQS